MTTAPKPQTSSHVVRVVTLAPLSLAVVRRTLRADELQAVWPKALDEVWAFVRHHNLKAGRNVFVYRDNHDRRFTLEAGVEIFAPLPSDEQVFGAQTPSGRAATTEHWGSYDGIPLAHAAVRRHCEAAGLTRGGVNWEVYGHYPSDSTPPLTEVFYSLAG
jgi:effector-binding domain-containing protein